MGQVDYSALNRKLEVENKDIQESKEPQVESTKAGVGNYQDDVRTSQVSVKASWAGYNLEEILTDSPAKRAVRYLIERTCLTDSRPI